MKKYAKRISQIAFSSVLQWFFYEEVYGSISTSS